MTGKRKRKRKRETVVTNKETKNPLAVSTHCTTTRQIWSIHEARYGDEYKP